MKQWILSSAVVAGLIFLGSCGSDKAGTEVSSKKLSNEDALDAEMKAIDESASKSDIVANSLRYSKENGESIVVLAHLSDKNEMLKIEEKFSDGNGKNNGTIIYYMKDKFPFATKESFEDYTNPEAQQFVERISYYDSKGKVLATKEKRVAYEDLLVSTPFVAITPHACSVDRAMKVLDQKGEYETTFQGFVQTESTSYLVIGQPGDDGFSSALNIEYEDSFIKDAMLNQKSNLNRKCRVAFKLSNSSGFEYQIYTAGEWIY